MAMKVLPGKCLWPRCLDCSPAGLRIASACPFSSKYTSWPCGGGFPSLQWQQEFSKLQVSSVDIVKVRGIKDRGCVQQVLNPWEV